MKLAPTITIGILAVSMTTPVYAAEPALDPLPQFTITDAQTLFENNAKPTQLAALSQQEMKETEGAWVNFAIGGAVGFGSYALTNYYNNRPITWRGSLYSIGTGALTGGMGGALIRASGGGLAGQIAWRPNMLASNFGASQYSRYRRW
ncbi:hypothetical protein EJD96_17395 [Herbaspirillum seropedicae]|uniref:hypothetical protein n=1 Tax=Herbaspirillum seropedicae TaxID=964 RepID=UPI001120ED39|nr:hypothetical protein [Herbaspirillum seropedicae]QDD65811.1 hypothetical protein EJD96_17395 [Herbaspirillum seropedicae]